MSNIYIYIYYFFCYQANTVYYLQSTYECLILHDHILHPLTLPIPKHNYYNNYLTIIKQHIWSLLRKTIS